MNKRLFNILLLTAITSGILGGFMMIIHKNREKELQKAYLALLPSFSNLKKLDSFKLNTPSVFIAFHPECEHCQYEAKSLNERHNDLKKAQIIMFTSAKDSLVQVFAHSFGLDTIDNIKVISDEKNEMRTAFGVKGIPTIFIYDAKGKLVKQYNGETKVDAIIKALQN